MSRSFLAVLLLASLAAPAAGKVLCPPGRFTLYPLEEALEVVGAGMPLELGAGRAELPGLCADAEARWFHAESGNWLSRVRARFPRCSGVRGARLRARWDLVNTPWCTRLQGTLRIGGRAVPFVADREPVCGNGLREAGEQCDGQVLGSQCCEPDCRVKPDCRVECSRHFPCGTGERCVYSCGSGGSCWPAGLVDCDGGPVCGCDRSTTYPNLCAASDAETGVAYFGTCRPPALAPRR